MSPQERDMRGAAVAGAVAGVLVFAFAAETLLRVVGLAGAVLLAISLALPGAYHGKRD